MGALSGTVGTAFEETYRRVARARKAESFLAYYADHASWYDVRAFPAPAGLTVYFRDVTDAKKTEAALLDSEERRRLALDAAELGAWNFDTSTGVVQGDARLRDIWGVGSGDLDYQHMLSVVHADDQARVDEAVTAATREVDPQPFSVEFRVVHANDDIRWVYSRGRATFAGREGRGKLLSLDGTLVDITERKRVDGRLRDAQDEFRTLADNMAQFAWMADATGARYWFNRRWYDYTGTRFEDMRGWGWKSVHHPEHVDGVVERLQRFLEVGEPWEDTFPLRARDGRFSWFLSRVVPIRNADGAIVRWFGTNTDITEQRDTAEALRQVAAELSRADHRKNEFLATLAHELRNPLAPIRSSLEVIRLSGDSGPPVERARLVMERQVRQMARLVDDLLDVSRITTDKLELRRERTDLAAVIGNAVESSRPLLDARGIRWTVALPQESIPLDVDVTRLAQVFMNLLNNAAKFTDHGGRVDVTATRTDAEVAVTVKDDGVGIAAQHLAGIFDMFSQVTSSLDRSHAGLGIGLTLVRRLVELHGGRVEAHSEGLGKGSAFVVHLALATQVPEPSPPVATESGGLPAALRVLVVDDNKDAAISLAEVLELNGHVTRTVHDGLAGLEAAMAWRPDLVLLDIGLPGLNGFEVARRIREQPWGAAMVLCAMTGWGQESDKRKSKDAGFDRHLVKPVDPAMIDKVIADMTTRVGAA